MAKKPPFEMNSARRSIHDQATQIAPRFPQGEEKQFWTSLAARSLLDTPEQSWKDDINLTLRLMKKKGYDTSQLKLPIGITGE